MNEATHYFAGGNTSIGFYSVFNRLSLPLQRVYILFGATQKTKSALLQRLGALLQKKGIAIEYIHALLDHHRIEGLIAPAIHLGIIDGNGPHSLQPTYPGVRDRYVCFDDAWVDRKMQNHRSEIMALYHQREEHKQHVYKQFALAKKAHERKEHIYVSAMDFAKADQASERILAELFIGQDTGQDIPFGREFFMGAATEAGVVHFVDAITASLQKRYILKGRSGSGKSTFMLKIARAAEANGLHVNYYRCSFDPASFDMIVIPAIQTAFIDGTSPHVVEPTRHGDEVIDLFLLAIDPTVEMERASEIEEADRTYRSHVRTAIHHLQEQRQLHERIENLYDDALNYDALTSLETAWIADVMRYVEEFS